MSSNKSFSTETSDRYGLALFEVANESSEIETIENVLEHPYEGEILDIQTKHSIDKLSIN